jgi:hypothetical protein
MRSQVFSLILIFINDFISIYIKILYESIKLLTLFIIERYKKLSANMAWVHFLPRNKALSDL